MHEREKESLISSRFISWSLSKSLSSVVGAIIYSESTETFIQNQDVKLKWERDKAYCLSEEPTTLSFVKIWRCYVSPLSVKHWLHPSKVSRLILCSDFFFFFQFQYSWGSMNLRLQIRDYPYKLNLFPWKVYMSVLGSYILNSLARSLFSQTELALHFIDVHIRNSQY